MHCCCLLRYSVALHCWRSAPFPFTTPPIPSLLHSHQPTPCRREQAELLAKSLPLPFSYEGYMAETLFGQMLLLPQPPLKVLAYCSIINDVCRLLPSFPRYMSAYIRECYNRVPFMDPLVSSWGGCWDF